MQFENWTVIGKQVYIGKQYGFLCRCICGKERLVRKYQLTSGRSKSCGCIAVEKAKATNTTHGMTKTTEFKTWSCMIERCYTSGRKDEKSYYAKGIKVCDRWKNDFSAFYKDMGHRPKGMTLDRIDGNGNYEPSNCRWATPKQQALNRSTTHRLSYDGKSYTVEEASFYFDIPVTAIYKRLKLWGNTERVLTEKVRAA
jgi:hypothetical protein